jgi:transposase
VVLLAADGVANQEIAAQVEMSRPTVNRWRKRYAAYGMAGLSDVKRPGRPRRIDQSKIITETLKPPRSV